jgi:hypothetical protein
LREIALALAICGALMLACCALLLGVFLLLR